MMKSHYCQHTAPTISDQTFSITEDASLGTVIGTVIASDADGDQLSYTITAGNTDDIFSIGSTTGELTLTGALDFNATSKVLKLTKNE